MNARVTFDTHAFVKRLETVGMEITHAEPLADALGDIVFESLATKPDLRELEIGIKAQLRELELSLKADLKEFELRMTGRLGAIVAGSTALTVAVLGALITLA